MCGLVINIGKVRPSSSDVDSMYLTSVFSLLLSFPVFMCTVVHPNDHGSDTQGKKAMRKAVDAAWSLLSGKTDHHQSYVYLPVVISISFHTNRRGKEVLGSCCASGGDPFIGL